MYRLLCALTIFGRVQIIKTIIQPNTNIIRIVALNFEAMSLPFIIVNVNIIILDILSHSASFGWLSGRVVSVPDSGSEEHGFESQSRRY